MDDTRLAWLAGFFDGEGSVLIYRRTKTMPKGITVPYQIRATVTNTRRDAIDLFRPFGGCVKEYAPHKGRRRAWKWNIQCRAAGVFLRAILPFLVVKREEAELALLMQDTIERFKHRSHPNGRWGQIPLPSEEIAYRDSLHAKLQDIRKPA